MSNSTLRVFAVVFLLLQAIGAAIWWLAIMFWPQSHSQLLPDGISNNVLALLLPADAILFVGGSLAAAWAISKRRAAAIPLLAIHTGAALYATAIAWTAAIRTESAWVSAILMVPSLIVLPGLLISFWRRRWHES